MTAIQEFVRRPTRVQALRLDTPLDMAVALVWLNGHHVSAVMHGDTLVVYNSHGVRMPAGLGQWLALEPSGAFNVYDDQAFTGPGDTREFDPGDDLDALVKAIAEPST